MDLEPSTPSPAAVDTDESVLLDYLTAQPQRDQREADPELPAGSDAALPLVHLQRMEADDAAQRERDIDDIEAGIETLIREAGTNMELDDDLLPAGSNVESDDNLFPFSLSTTGWIEVPEVVAAAPPPIDWLGGSQAVVADLWATESLVAPEVVAAAPLPAESPDDLLVDGSPVQHGPALNQLAGEPGIDGPRTWKARPIECPASLALQAAPPAKAESSAMAEGEVTSTLAAPPAKAASSAMADGEFTITLTPSGQMLSERSQAATNEAFSERLRLFMLPLGDRDRPC